MKKIKNFILEQKIAIAILILLTLLTFPWYGTAFPDSTSIGNTITVSDDLYVGNRVGVRTTSPIAPFHIDGSSEPYRGLHISNRDGVQWAASGITWQMNSNTPIMALGQIPDNGGLFFQSRDSSGENSNNIIRILPGGNVGIGTASPEQRLHVNGNVILGSTSFPAVLMRSGASNANWRDVNRGARAYATGVWSNNLYFYYRDDNNTPRFQHYTFSAMDIAEWYNVAKANISEKTGRHNLLKGNIVSLSLEGKSTVEISNNLNSSRTFGVVSTKPYMIMGGRDLDSIDGDINSMGDSFYLENTRVPIATTGRIPVIVSNENGTINPGDYIGNSTLFNGIGSKFISDGLAIGIATDYAFHDSREIIDVSCVTKINWPPSDGSDEEVHPVYRTKDGTLISKVMTMFNLQNI